jgi:hypothetical protein
MVIHLLKGWHLVIYLNNGTGYPFGVTNFHTMHILYTGLKIVHSHYYIVINW